MAVRKIKIERVTGKLEYAWFCSIYSITNLVSSINKFMTVPTNAIYGISFPDSISASQFFECIGLTLIIHYYVKKKAKLILVPL